MANHGRPRKHKPSEDPCSLWARSLDPYVCFVGAFLRQVVADVSSDIEQVQRDAQAFLLDGHRLAPWRSPYLLWRIETYCGVKMQQIGFLEFWKFIWHERSNLWRFLKWTAEMERYVHPKPKGV